MERTGVVRVLRNGDYTHIDFSKPYFVIISTLLIVLTILRIALTLFYKTNTSEMFFGFLFIGLALYFIKALVSTFLRSNAIDIYNDKIILTRNHAKRAVEKKEILLETISGVIADETEYFPIQLWYLNIIPKYHNITIIASPKNFSISGPRKLFLKEAKVIIDEINNARNIYNKNK